MTDEMKLFWNSLFPSYKYHSGSMITMPWGSRKSSASRSDTDTCEKTVRQSWECVLQRTTHSEYQDIRTLSFCQ